MNKNTETKNFLLNYPDPDYKILKDLSINLEQVNPTHILDKIKGKKVNYKFGESKINMDILEKGPVYLHN
jgi:hypothetical protein